jgi:uncharacterized protein
MMPEYLAPGVYVEETTFRPKTIEGVATSTAGFGGACRYGPVDGEPELLTSFLDFERIYGGLDQLEYDGEQVPNHLAHGVRAFFENGGRRLYVARVFRALETGDGAGPDADADIVAANKQGRAAGATVRFGGRRMLVEARHPGAAGNTDVTFRLAVGPSILHRGALRGGNRFDTVLVLRGGEGAAPADAPAEGAYWVDEDADGDTVLRRRGAEDVALDTLPGSDGVHVMTVAVTVGAMSRFASTQTWEDLALHPEHRSSITTVFRRQPVGRLTELYAPLIVDAPGVSASDRVDVLLRAVGGGEGAILTLARAVVGANGDAPGSFTLHLTGGSDGQRPEATDLAGTESGPGRRSGLLALEDVDDVSIVAAPGMVDQPVPEGDDTDGAIDAMQALVNHAEKMRYRIAVLDTRSNLTVGEVRSFRGVFDSTRAALYYPWVTIDDPVTRQPLTTPPSGFIAGIYARNDVDRGVHKAPANEIVRLASRFEFPVNRAQQDVLNPEGVNCLRFFEGRGFRVWGARTATSDPEWKYVNLRRYFNYVEYSVERATQWAVFEPNGSLLWGQVRRTVEDFLFNEFANRRLLGETPEEAYFVRCDLSTMTQNDLDNGRLVCLVGIAPLRPAEFVIFRIGQKTLDSRG